MKEDILWILFKSGTFLILNIVFYEIFNCEHLYAYFSVRICTFKDLFYKSYTQVVDISFCISSKGWLGHGKYLMIMKQFKN